MLVPPAEIVGRVKATISECTVNDVHECLNSDTLVIDVREPAEYQRAHLPGAVHVPRGMLEFEIHKLVERSCGNQNIALEDQPLVVYCGTGGRSALAAASLQSLGYKNVRSMAGGVAAWTQAEFSLAQPS